MKKVIFFLGLSLAATASLAQGDSGAAAAEAVVLDIFEGMRQGDSARVASHILRDAGMFSVYHDNTGKTVLREGSLQGWLDAIGAPREESLDERLWDIEVRTDGPLATVWTEYALYIGNTLSHCGVDAFQLFHDGDNWKVFHVADTRRRECDIPEEVQK